MLLNLLPLSFDPKLCPFNCSSGTLSILSKTRQGKNLIFEYLFVNTYSILFACFLSKKMAMFIHDICIIFNAHTMGLKPSWFRILLNAYIHEKWIPHFLTNQIVFDEKTITNKQTRPVKLILVDQKIREISEFVFVKICGE